MIVASVRQGTISKVAWEHLEVDARHARAFMIRTTRIQAVGTSVCVGGTGERKALIGHTWATVAAEGLCSYGLYSHGLYRYGLYS